MKRVLFPVLALLAAVPPLPGAARAQDLELAACRFAAFDELAENLPEDATDPEAGDALCGRYEVWEDRAARAGRTIALNVIVLPHTGEDPASDPVFFFGGGPGEAVSTWGWVPLAFAELRTRRDIVLVDQRGTGGSHPLTCAPPGSDDDLQGYLNPMLDLDDVVACREDLERTADLRFYTTQHHADDIDDVRAALGYERINLWGGSYGTRPVLVYLRRHLEHARAAMISGVAHTSFKYPLHHASAGQRALDMLFAACREDPACTDAVGDPLDDLREVMELFAQGPVSTEIDHPTSDETARVRVYREVVAERLRSLMYSSGNAVRIPGILDRAARTADLGELAELIIQYERGFTEGVNWFTGMWMSITCSEDVPFITDADVARETGGTVFGDYRVRTHREACEHWPQGPLPEGFAEPVVSDTPVLIVSGDMDPATPPEGGAYVARHLAHSLHVVVRQGHGPTDGACSVRVATEFFERGSTEGLDVGCLEAVDLPQWTF
jgi:pimeloyl-ACP methyl ester carboxylesterase